MPENVYSKRITKGKIEGREDWKRHTLDKNKSKVRSYKEVPLRPGSTQ